MTHSSAGRGAALLLLCSIGAAAAAIPTSAASEPTSVASVTRATDVLARVGERDARVTSYAVPVRMDIHLHRFITLHFHLNGTQYFKGPDRLAMELRGVPAQYRRLFAELGTPMTWPDQYALRLIAPAAADAPYQLEGVPKRASDVARMLVDVGGDATAPLHARWLMRDGGTIDMRITEPAASGYELPTHAEADISVGGYKVHAAIDYGPYAVNRTLADWVFAGS